MRLVQAWFDTRKDRESNFHHRGGAVNDVQACLSAKKEGESSSNYCGGSSKLILVPGKIEKAVFITE